MLAQYNGVTWSFGVGRTRLCDFNRACKGELPETSSLKVDVDRAIADHRRMFERTGDSRHLDYEKAFECEIRKKGSRKYYLEDTVEEGKLRLPREAAVMRPRGGYNRPFRPAFLGPR